MADQSQWLHNESNGAIAFMALATVFVVSRCIGVGLFNREQKQLRSTSWETALIMVSWMAFMPLCIAAIVQARAYLAYFSANPAQRRSLFTTIHKASYVSSATFPIACALPKISICCMYLGIFRVNSSMRHATQATIAFLVVNAVAWWIPSIAVCRPISAIWSLEVKPGQCINLVVLGTWISLPHIVSDLVILALPMPLLWNMSMSRAKKVGVTITFLAGSIGIVGGCLRLAFYIRRTYTVSAQRETTKDVAIDVIVSYLEPGMYLIAACLPRLRSLCSQVHASLSASLASLRARRQYSPSHDSASTAKSDGQPRINVKLTGQGNLESLAKEPFTVA